MSAPFAPTPTKPPAADDLTAMCLAFARESGEHTTSFIPSIGMTFRRAGDRARELLDLNDASAERDPEEDGEEAAQRYRNSEERYRLQSAIFGSPCVTIGDMLVKVERMADPDIGVAEIALEADQTAQLRSDLQHLAARPGESGEHVTDRLAEAGASPSPDMLTLCRWLNDIWTEHEGSMATHEAQTDNERGNLMQSLILRTPAKNVADLALQAVVAHSFVGMVAADLKSATSPRIKSEADLPLILQRATDLLHFIDNAGPVLAAAAKVNTADLLGAFMGVFDTAASIGRASE